MIDFLHSTVVPILAVFWMVVGGLMFAFITSFAVAVHHFGLPVRDADTDELADLRQVAKIEWLLGAGGLAFAVAGAWLYWGEDQALKGQFLLIAWAAGGFIALIVLWRSFRR